MEQATHFINSSNVGDRVTLHCFASKERRISKKGEAYWSLSLGDVTGEIYANIWAESHLFPFFADIADGQYMKVTGVIGEYNGLKNIQIQTVKELEEPGSFIVDEAAIKKDIGLRIRGMKDPGLQALLFAVFKKKSFADAYFRAPFEQESMAGGSWRGGAAAFASKLCTLIDHAADGLFEWNHHVDGVRTRLNKEFLMTLAILEPIGRVRAFQVTGHRVSRTEEGELFSEQYLTNEMLQQYLPTADLPEEKKMLLKHAIASVPGKAVPGALVYDRTKEAIAFNILWNLNLQMMHFEQLSRIQPDEAGFVKLFRKTLSLREFKPYEPLTDEQVEEMAEASRVEGQEAPEEVQERLEEDGLEEALAETADQFEEQPVPTTSMMEALAGGEPGKQ